MVTVGVIARNEELSLPDLLRDIEAQTFPHAMIEVILVDGMSTDSTKAIMDEFAKSKKNDFAATLVYRNERQIQPCGWNIVIGASRGDAIIRVDAHARIPSDFVATSIATLESGEDVCGGVRPTVMKDPTGWQSVLHMAEESAFGSSVASCRRNADKRYVNSVFHGAYKREVFSVAGLFDERLRRTEDNELHYRIRQSGYKICLSPEIKSVQLARASLGKMLTQKWLNGYWIGKTLYIEPRCFRPYHFAPLVFVLTLLVFGIVGFLLANWMPFIVLVTLYLVADLVLSMCAIGASWPCDFRALALPVLFPLIHVSYGMGTLIGIVAGPFWRFKAGRTGSR
nr:glycosyltransferase family 2 protein [Parvibacter caecicola]